MDPTIAKSRFRTGVQVISTDDFSPGNGAGRLPGETVCLSPSDDAACTQHHAPGNPIWKEDLR